MVAGGTGTRMRSKVAKQFLLLEGMPIVMHSFEAFRRFDPEMQFVLVLFPNLVNEWKKLCEEHGFDLVHEVVNGGEERFHSVRNGLEVLQGDVEIVAIHDAVRPLVSQNTISGSFRMAAKEGAAIPVVPVVDTIRQQSETIDKTLPRHELKAVQTPQVFRTSILRDAYDVPFDQNFTDDASVVEKKGVKIYSVAGNRKNIKITTSEDLLVAESFLKSFENS